MDQQLLVFSQRAQRSARVVVVDEFGNKTWSDHVGVSAFYTERVFLLLFLETLTLCHRIEQPQRSLREFTSDLLQRT
jgi:hypothetical protein